MMRLSKTIAVGGRQITVREFDAETVYALLEWLEQYGGELKAKELLFFKSDLLVLVRDCIVPADGQPLDFDSMGFGALMEIVNGLQAVNQAFLTLLIRMGKVPLDGGDTASPSS
jgi:hypothetical protein